MIRTLIVDDDFMVAAIHRGYTDKVAGFHVVGVAHTARDALAAVERLRPDLVVLDVYLPDATGLSVLEELRKGHPGVDAIMVTAAKEAASVLAALQGGALHYIVKPFDFARYEQTLANYRRFREQRQRTAGAPTIEQTDVDRLFALRATAPADEQALPKGLNRPTLDLVLRCLTATGGPMSAQAVAEGTGISRGTARRYLEYLEQAGRAAIELRYGAAGRPEHRYRLV